MIGIQTELKIANLFKAISDGEKQIEITRQVLAEQDEFEPYTAFKRIDRLSIGYLTYSSMHRFLRDNDIIVSERDVKNLIKVYDTNKDDRLSYTEFLNMILPKTSSVLRKICTSRSSYYVSKYDPLPYEAEWALARVLNKEIDYFRKIELLKEDLVSRYDWNLMDAFKLIDTDRIGYLTHELLYFFLRSNGIPCSDEDILALLRRIDEDDIGKINYSSFVDIISPNDPYYKTKGIRATYDDYPKQRSASPVRRTLASSYYSPNKKLTNLDYFDYLQESAKRSASKDRTTSKSNTGTSFYSPSKSKKDDLEKELSQSRSGFRTPSKKSPVAERFSSPSRTSASKKLAQSPMKGNEEENLAMSLKQQVDDEKNLENMKNDIALRSDFTLMDAFSFFDEKDKGYITRGELEEGMRYFNVFPTSTELFLVMRKYDSDNDSLLKYSEFRAMLSPKSEDYASILAKRVPKYDDNIDLDDVFSWGTKKAFTKLLQTIIDNEVNAEALRQKINRRPLFNIYEAFKALDKNDMGYLGIEEFKELLLDHGIYASSKDIANLISRYDKNQDGKVTYSEFVQEITPKSPTKIY